MRAWGNPRGSPGGRKRGRLERPARGAACPRAWGATSPPPDGVRRRREGGLLLSRWDRGECAPRLGATTVCTGNPGRSAAADDRSNGEDAAARGARRGASPDRAGGLRLPRPTAHRAGGKGDISYGFQAGAAGGGAQGAQRPEGRRIGLRFSAGVSRATLSQTL